MMPALEAERALLMATAAAVGAGSLSRSSASQILGDWRAAARPHAPRERPQRLGPEMAAALGIRVVYEPAPASNDHGVQEVRDDPESR